MESSSKTEAWHKGISLGNERRNKQEPIWESKAKPRLFIKSV